MKEKYYRLVLVAIIFLALLLRFYSFSNRWQIYSDQARDVMVARGALKHKTIPLIGSFSSAGPFVFGPLFYWFIMISYLISPNFLISPWVLITLIDVLLVFIMAEIGKRIEGKKLALVLGFLAAISPNQLSRASNLTQHTLVSITSALTILFFILFLKRKKIVYLFLMGLSIGLGISMHYQALNLLLYLIAIFFLSRAKTKKLSQKKFVQIFFAVLSLGFGLLLPSLPLLYWDYGQGWANLKNILDYFLIGQYRIWVSNRWLTYSTVFWPNFWSRIIGGNLFIGFSLMILLGWFGIYQLLRKKLKKEIFWLGIIFAIQIILNRYYRGERFEGYVLYFQPLVLLFSAWVVVSLIKLNKFLGFLFLLTITFFTLKQDIKEIKLQDNQVDKVWQIVAILKARYPDKKFSFYDCYYLEPSLSQMLSLFLDFQGLNDEKNGVLLGVSQGPIKHPPPTYHFKLNKDFYIYELNQQLISNEERWINVNSDYVYQDILWWWENKPLKSTFSLTNHLKERLRL